MPMCLCTLWSRGWRKMRRRSYFWCPSCLWWRRNSRCHSHCKVDKDALHDVYKMYSQCMSCRHLTESELKNVEKTYTHAHTHKRSNLNVLTSKEGRPAVTPSICSTATAVFLWACLISSTIKCWLIEWLSGKNLKIKGPFIWHSAPGSTPSLN